MLLQTNSYIVPKERRAEHARLIRRFRQALARIGCDQFEVYEQVGANWSPGGANGRYVQIMRFRDRQHQQAVQAAEREDHGAQHIIAEFCELINFPYQQQHGYFATGFYTSVLPVGPRQAIEAAPVEEIQEEPVAEEAPLAAEAIPEAEEPGEWHETHEGEAQTPEHAEPAHEEAVAEHAGQPAEETLADESPIEELPQADTAEEAALAEVGGGIDEMAPDEAMSDISLGHEKAPPRAMTDEEAEAALLAEETPAQIAADAAVADVFLDTISEEDLPAEELGGHAPPPPPLPEEATSGGEEMPFAESPIANPPAEDELVTAGAFVPHDTNLETADEPLDLGEVELPELSPIESQTLEEPLDSAPHAEIAASEPSSGEVVEAEIGESAVPHENIAEEAHLEPGESDATRDASHELLHAASLDDMGLDFAAEDTAHMPTPDVGGTEEPTAETPTELPTEADAAAPHAAELGEQGLEFEDVPPALEPSSHDAASAPVDVAELAKTEVSTHQGTEPPLAFASAAGGSEEQSAGLGDEAGREHPGAEPGKDASNELSPTEGDDFGLEFEDAAHPIAGSGEPSSTEPAEAESAKHESSQLFDEDLILGLEPDHQELIKEPPAESHHDDLAELGHEFNEVAASAASSPGHDEEHAPVPADATAHVPADVPILDEPLAHQTPSSVPSDAAPAEALTGEFALDEGLIFDEDEIPGEGLTDETAHPPAEAGHDQAHHASPAEGEAEPLLDAGGLPEDAGFDSLLDDTNMLVNVPASEHGHDVPANHTDRQTANVNAGQTPVEKDADLLEFEAFLRQLDEGSGHRSS